MKKFLFLSACLLVASAAFAQRNYQSNYWQPRYQGDVIVGYTFGVGDAKVDRLNIHMINGARVSRNVSAGVGVGLDYYCTNGFSDLALPVYLDLKGYVPVSKVTTLFASIDVGYSFGLTDGFDGAGGVLAVPTVGVGFKVADNKSINLGLSYNYQAFSKSGPSVSFNGLGLKAGYSF